jgi:CHASE2 domain-containing sensor protein
VTIDEQDLVSVPDTWPWNRRFLAKVLDQLHQAEVAGVGLFLDLHLERCSRRDPEQDLVLIEAMKKNGAVVYLGAGPGEALERTRPSPAKFFREALAASGPVTFVFDTRKNLTHLKLSQEGDQGGSLAAMQWLLKRVGAKVGSQALADSLDGEGRVRVPFHLYRSTWGPPLGPPFLPHHSIRRFSLRDLSAGKVSTEILKNSLVLVGASAIVLHDLYDTDVQSNMPAVQVIGMVLEGACQGDVLWDLPAFWEASTMVVLCLLVVLGLRVSTASRMFFGVLAGCMVWGSGGLLIFGLWGCVLPLTRPMGLALGTLLVEILRQRSEVQSDFLVTDPMVEREARLQMDGAMACMVRGEYEQALKEFAEVAVMETVLRSRAEHRLVLALLNLERVGEAGVLVESLDFEKLGEEEIYLLARELDLKGLKKESRRVFEKLYLIDPDFEDVRAQLAELRHQLSGFSEDELVETIARRILDRRFESAELFNKGGGGFLFRVTDRLRPREQLALKILSPLQMNDPLVVRRFLQEAHLVKTLDHPNLIRIFDVFEASLPYYTMEFLEADSIMDRIQAEGVLPADLAREIIRQACAGLGFAHGHGIVHRDVKPHNLLLLKDGRVKVIDFGIARALGQSQASASGSLTGTPLYMSPEQVRGEKTCPASDQFSLGLVLFEMLYGELPFPSMQARLTSAAVRPAPRETIPEDLVDVMMRALQPQPESRYALLEDMAKDL